MDNEETGSQPNTESTCETETAYQSSCEATGGSTNKFTQVKTVYARAAILLLAINFCLTSYVVINLSKVQQEATSTAASTPNTTAKKPTTIPQTLEKKESQQATGGQEATETRKKD